MSRPGKEREGGSGIVLALFVLVLLTGLGISLVFLSQTEVRMSQADVRSKVAYFIAETGLEEARGILYDTNVNEEFSDDLKRAAGPDGVMDFDHTAIRAVYDSNGDFTGFTGYGDDVPLRTMQKTADGWHIAFLTNDPLDLATAVDPLEDRNNRVVITGVGAGSDRSFEIVQAILEKKDIMPTPPPAAITLLGPLPAFDSGDAAAKLYVGEDCAGLGGVPGLYLPVVGTVDGSAAVAAERGVQKPWTFTSGAESGLDTVADLTDPTEPTVISGGMGPIDGNWMDCQFLLTMAEQMEVAAEHICRAGRTCTLPTFKPNTVLFVDDDIAFDQTVHGQGTLFVTGELEMNGRASWHGVIFVVGEGRFTRSGGGNGEISGALLVADIAGPDDVYGTRDDCTSGVTGFSSVYYDISGGGTGDSIYCTADIANANPVSPYDIVSFVQR